MYKAIGWCWVFIGWTSFMATPGFAGDAAAADKSPDRMEVERDSKSTADDRASGIYRVANIEKNPDNEYVIRFEAESKGPRHNHLILTVTGLNLELAEGQVLRLSAEVVLGKNPKEREITQVLLFLPSQEYGVTPIWLLSKTHDTHEMRGARWLEMHAPQADYQVF